MPALDALVTRRSAGMLSALVAFVLLALLARESPYLWWVLVVAVLTVGTGLSGLRFPQLEHNLVGWGLPVAVIGVGVLAVGTQWERHSPGIAALGLSSFVAATVLLTRTSRVRWAPVREMDWGEVFFSIGTWMGVALLVLNGLSLLVYWVLTGLDWG